MQPGPKLNHKDTEHRGLIWIGALKILKGAFFIALGFGLLRLIHEDLYLFALQAVQALHLDPDRELIARLLDRVMLVTPHRMKQLTALVFLYASLDFVEGTGLVLQKSWAEYVTLVLTAALLPLEVLKLVHHPNHWMFLLFAGNVLILLYLIWIVRPISKGRQQVRMLPPGAAD